MPFLASRRRKPPPLSGAFFAPSDLSDFSLIRALAIVSADILSSHRFPRRDDLFLQRRNSRSLLWKIEILLSFFESLLDSSSRLPSPVLLCLKELYILIHRCKMLMDYCALCGRIWLLLLNPLVSGRFHDLNLEISTLLDVLPIEELDLNPDVRDQMRFLWRRCGNSKLYIDADDEFLRLTVFSFLREFENGCAPDRSELQMVLVDRLGIRDARACQSEIEFLEDQINVHEEDADPAVLTGVAALFRYSRFLLFGFDVLRSRESNIVRGFRRSESNADAGEVTLVIPKDFCCPISLELMRDPVIISTGQTYDRASISQWMDEGHPTCPNSGQALVHTVLTPNQALRSWISQWCAEHGVPYDSPESYEASMPCYSRAAIEANKATVSMLLKQLLNGSLDAQTIAVRELRLLAKTGKENRACIAELGGIPLLKPLLCSSNAVIQVNSVTTILNLSIHDKNKVVIMEEQGCLNSIVWVLRHGLTNESRENAAATLFSLSAMHEYKKRIAFEAGAVEALACLLKDGSARGKRDAVMALFNLSTHSECAERMAEFGAVSALIGALGNEMVAEDAAGALALLVRRPALAHAVGKDDRAVSSLIGLMRRGTPRGKENAVAALQEMCRKGGASMTQKVARLPSLGGLVQSLMLTGTKRARRKAASLARMCHKCELAAAAAALGGVDYSLSRSGSLSVSMAISVPVL
ncbi:Zinc finger RING/FYVE/PHD-type protein [Dioscorea alata]|uniref:Zinc finger RING/FYVE/PHD-type protein n=1 Tax=Dioscorea alata TaxID=55571 RepID=A0ACB7TRU6_DIOAL|nr:Zinc finger RING/FYVE/PHD-type protein [Dioscorea alata]